MPPAIFAALGAGAVTASLLSAGSQLALAIGGTYLLSRFNRPKAPKPSDGQVEVQQAVPPRMFHYGRVKVSGPLAFMETKVNPAYANPLFKITLLSAREIDAIEEQYLDDTLVTVNGSGLVTNAFGLTEANVFTHLGTTSQAADAKMLTVFWETWTTDHRLRGIAYAVTYFRSQPDGGLQFEVFPNGPPVYRAVIRASKLYDPRLDTTQGGSGTHRADDQSTWAWSENAALAVLDWLTYYDPAEDEEDEVEFGYGLGMDRIDLASFRAMANICDEDVELAAGGTENRYRIATTIYLTERKTDVLARLLDACDGELYPTSAGKIAIRGGAWSLPDVTLDADAGHIIEGEFQDGVDALTRYNELAFTYLSPVHGYGEVEGDPWRNEAEIAETGIIRTQQVDFNQVPSHAQARRLAKIRMLRDNPRWQGQIRTNFFGLDAIGQRCVNVNWSELDEPPNNFNGPFWLGDDLVLLPDATGITVSVTSADPTAYDWDADTEEGNAATPAGDPDIFFVDFSTGSAADWTVFGGGMGTKSYESVGGTISGIVLRLIADSASARRLTYSGFANAVSNKLDIYWIGRLRTETNDRTYGSFGIGTGASMDTHYHAGLRFKVGTDHNQIARSAAGTLTELATSGEAISLDQWYAQRLRIDTTVSPATLKFKRWDYGGAEPGTWDNETTSTAITGEGSVGIFLQANNQYEVQFMGVGINGRVAPASPFDNPGGEF